MTTGLNLDDASNCGLDAIGGERLRFEDKAAKCNHQVFRYPAKFHPPVARALIDTFSRPGQTVLDPFCGSGTVLVEACVAGRSAVGTDVDPLAIFVSKAKIQRYDLTAIGTVVTDLRERIASMRDADLAFWGDFERDVPQSDYEAALPLFAQHIPELPSLGHWFRRRVVLQLAALRALIEGQKPAVSGFLRLCFAAIIRNGSNADPVPVSGLEVTSYMLARERAGRTIDPYELFDTSLVKNLAAMHEFQELRSPITRARAAIADARYLSNRGTGIVDCIITSPPYLAAVDYYRRHTLEMYWLGLTASREERLVLMTRYIGRDRVGARHMDDACHTRGLEVARRHLANYESVKPERARAFRHYCASMAQALARLADLLPPGRPLVLVVGDVRFSGQQVSMVDLIVSAAPDGLELIDRLWYPLANRYMSYARKHEADIDKDHVLVFRRGH